MKRTGAETRNEKLQTAFMYIKNAGPYCADYNGRNMLRAFYSNYKEAIDLNPEMVDFFSQYFPTE